MFCPGCGIEEKNFNQFCRACGTDLRTARKVLEMPDAVTASASVAREEIGRAFAAKILEIQTGTELKIVAEDVLPEIEKFLESPEEKRLRRMRVGALVASIGFGVAFAFVLASGAMRKDDLLMVAAAGFICFSIGIGFLINGFLLTVPKKAVADRSSEGEGQRALDARNTTNELVLPPAATNFVSSVTEETTRTLRDKQLVDKQ